MSKENSDFTSGLNMSDLDRLNNGCMIHRVADRLLAEIKQAAEVADEAADEEKVGDGNGSAA